jgi:uncharacterized damage-inducible protein DinB
MNIAKQNIGVLDQIDKLLDMLNVTVYKKKQPYINNSTIGQHVRHILEFYQCILNNYPLQNISYDKRSRNTDLEESLDLSKNIIIEIKNSLGLLNKDMPITLSASYAESTEENCEKIASSLKRELAYAMDHSIHHLAIVKIILTIEGIQVDSDIGVAPSTLRYKQEITRKAS